MLFDRICRENGVEHLLTKPRSPTTTGKIERFHRTMRAEFDTRRPFTSPPAAQAELNAWVEQYNQTRPHQTLSMATPAERLQRRGPCDGERPRTVDTSAFAVDRTGDKWVSRRAAANGVVSVSEQISVGKHRAGHRIDVHVGPELLQLWDGPGLLKTVTRDSRGEVRKKRASQG